VSDNDKRSAGAIELCSSSLSGAQMAVPVRQRCTRKRERERTRERERERELFGVIDEIDASEMFVKFHVTVMLP